MKTNLCFQPDYKKIIINISPDKVSNMGYTVKKYLHVVEEVSIQALLFSHYWPPVPNLGEQQLLKNGDIWRLQDVGNSVFESSNVWYQSW